MKHFINNKLMIIDGYTELMQYDMVDDVQDCLAEIRQAVREILEILDAE